MPNLPESLKFLLNKTFYIPLLSVLILILMIILSLKSCDKPQDIHKNNFIIGRDSSWHTLKTFGKEKNLIAFTNELMFTISQKTHLHLKWYESQSSALMDNLLYDYCDAILEITIPTPFDKKTLIFSEILLETGPVLAMPIIPDFNAENLDEKTFGLNWNTLLGYNIALQTFINAHHLLIIDYTTPLQAFDAMIRNQIDGVIIESMRARSFEGGLYKGVVKIFTKPLTEEGLRLIALKNKTTETFIDVFNQAFNELKTNGQYNALLNKWGLIVNEESSMQSDW